MADRIGPSRRLFLVQLAGGLGLRAGGASGQGPKQFRPTGRGSLFTVSLRSFLELDPAGGFQVAGVVVTAPPAWENTAAEALVGLKTTWALAPSGRTRTASTFNALEVLAGGSAGLPVPAADDLVAIHDAARPFASAFLLQRLAAAAAEFGAAVPGVPVTDTIVQVGAEAEAEPDRYLDRGRLLAVQTPQVFRWQPLWIAHSWAAGQGVDFTDDGGLLAHRGLMPAVVPGEQENWKVTTEGDWFRARDVLGG